METTQAHLADVDQTEPIHQSLADKELLPGQHLVDAGYVDSELLVTSQSDYQVQLFGPVRPNSSWQAQTEGAYDHTQFKVNWKKKQVTCPQGKKSITWRSNLDKWGNQGIQVRFSRQNCFSCPVRHLCVRSQQEPRALRLRPQAQHQALKRLRKQQTTPEWKKRYHRRAGVEGTISQGVRAFGLRKARYLGLAKVHLQHILTATAMNLVRLFAWLWEVPLAETRISRFAARGS